MLGTSHSRFLTSFFCQLEPHLQPKTNRRKGHSLLAWNLERKYKFNHIYPYYPWAMPCTIKQNFWRSFSVIGNYQLAAIKQVEDSRKALVLSHSKKLILDAFLKNLSTLSKKNKNLALIDTIFSIIFCHVKSAIAAIITQREHHSFLLILGHLPNLSKTSKEKKNLALLDTIFPHHFSVIWNPASSHKNTAWNLVHSF